jgi:type IV secretory pathway TraG/TraD family ATPase VirD4
VQVTVGSSLVALGVIAAVFVVWAGTGETRARWQAERTARAFGSAVWRQDSTRIASLTQSKSAHNVLCAARGPLARHWYGAKGAPRIVNRIRYKDTLEFAVRPPGTAKSFEFVIPLANPGRVDRYTVPKLDDSVSAIAFWHCLGIQR